MLAIIYLPALVPKYFPAWAPLSFWSRRYLYTATSSGLQIPCRKIIMNSCHKPTSFVITTRATDIISHFHQLIRCLFIISNRNALRLGLFLLLLAKIYNFWQVCSFVGVSVCLSVSLSVLSSITHERFDISSPNLVHIWNGWAVPVCDNDK